MTDKNIKRNKNVPLSWAIVVLGLVAACLGLIVIGSVIAVPMLRDDEPLPTIAAIARVEGKAPATKEAKNAFSVDRVYPQHNSIDNLVQTVAGEIARRESIYVTTWSEEGEPVPDHAYLVDLVIANSADWDRNQLLELTYVLFREAYHNFSGPLISITLIIRADDKGAEANCFLSIGLGARAAGRLLPDQKPADLESWFRKLKAENIYGDLGENELDLAYGGDPYDVPSCTLRNWKSIGQISDAQPIQISTATAIRKSSQEICREEVDLYLYQIQPFIIEFFDVEDVADATPAIALSSVIQDMQSVWREFQLIQGPSCVGLSALLIDTGMEAVIEGYLTFSEHPEYDFAPAVMLDQGNEQIIYGMDQILAVNEGKPTPYYDPVQALEGRSQAMAEVLGFGPTPEPLFPGSSIIAGSPTSDWQVSVYRVDYAQEFDDGLGGSLRRRASGRYVILFLNVTNLGNDTDLFFSWAAVELHDAYGNVYEVDELANDYAERYYGIVDESYLQTWIHPAETGVAIAVFDIPNGGGPYMLANSWTLDYEPQRVWVPIE